MTACLGLSVLRERRVVVEVLVALAVYAAV